MNVIDTIKSSFKRGNSLIKLIYINAGVFILLKLTIIVLLLFKISGEFILSYLAVPADLTQLIYRAWTPLTYMFLHEGFLHIFFNMFTLFWFGRIFLMFFSGKQLIGLYLIGGFMAALFYISAYNLFPYYADTLHRSILLGASGSIMAIIVATAFSSPDMELQVLFLGNIKLKYIAVFFILTSLFGITSNNGGGELAHLGGALAGYLFFVSLRQGNDLTKGVSRILDAISNLFGPRKLKIRQNPNPGNQTMSDAEYNINKARKMVEIDRILDKINTSGYESLSADEKKRLFEQGKKS
jgi:membrane associated rhomboid family serine protease